MDTLAINQKRIISKPVRFNVMVTVDTEAQLLWQPENA
jgi:hypothetical protein